jgi:4-amino-4-deoxy-L-arabinose transferase-like glycosyltransferase
VIGSPLALVAYAVLAVGYARLTPIWQNPDEPAHFNYVEYVASTGGLPELKPGDWDSALLERLKTGALQPGDSVASIRYEGWQPPLFYLAAAPVVALGGTADVPAAVMRLRLFDAVLGGVTVVLGYLVAREVLPVALAVAVPVVMAGVPMFAAVSASVSADPLANLLAAAALLYLVWRLRRSVNDWRWPLGAGALIGLGMLTKLALAIFVPLALGVVVLRAARPARETVLMLATAAVVMLPWLVHQVTTYGWTDPLALNRHSAVVLDQPRFPGLSPEYVVDFATTTFHSFWAQFGWMAVVAPARLYWTWGVLTLIGVAGFLRARACLSKPAWKLMIATVLTAGIAYVGYNLTFEQFQGRYLFVALAPLAILLVLGWAAWVPGRAQAWVTLLAAAGLVVLNAYALLRVLVPGFAPGPLTLLG